MRHATHSHNGKTFVTHTELSHDDLAIETTYFTQKVILSAVFGAIFFGIFLNLQLTIFIIISFLSFFYFIDLIFSAFLINRNFSQNPEISITQKTIDEAANLNWPVYTILCPLYKEARVLPQYIKALSRLDYPKDKLEVLLLLEADDTESISSVNSMTLPSFIKILIVPEGYPKTKPKALNYGFTYATGEYLVVYDAEDVPESDQLKKVVLAFKQLPQKVICLQAKLNFYNHHQNILTRLFTCEYSLWFDLILTGLQSLNAPIPLGGTSNHFKVSILHELKGWDPFNVTEDCDLGMRLVKRGYLTGIINSTTYEEANSRLLNWIRQRSRWIKGYYQTFFVHNRRPHEFHKNAGIVNFLIFQVIVGSKLFTLLINPILWIVTIAYFMFRAQLAPIIESWYIPVTYYLAVLSLIFGNFMYLYIYMIGAAKRGKWELIKYGYLVPVYWLLMSFSAAFSVVELITRPHYWQKTHHGFHTDAVDSVALAVE